MQPTDSLAWCSQIELGLRLQHTVRPNDTTADTRRCVDKKCIPETAPDIKHREVAVEADVGLWQVRTRDGSVIWSISMRIIE